ncbi:hypothetical protein SAMN05421741_101281 [Paenimyroides ummariense]|uniref:Uncharacterized protein n=1 Tax=Paenimyroides ummariense TaxID=913024 RepID=A0A1I4WJU6_9FLAO|nr:hypothetical protein SAMN05421741_101281 [Paenimyroides ummariense]
MGEKRIWNSLIMIPTIGFVLIYFFISTAIYKYGANEIYYIDSTQAMNEFFYNITYYFFSFGIIVLFSLGIIGLIYLIVMRKLLFSKNFFIYFIVLLLIYICSIKVDVNGYLNWFFD